MYPSTQEARVSKRPHIRTIIMPLCAHSHPYHYHVPARTNTKQIKTKQELANTFAYFLSRGAAAERFVSPELYSELVQSANNIASADYQVGGNAALMAQAFNQVRIGSEFWRGDVMCGWSL